MILFLPTKYLPATNLCPNCICQPPTAAPHITSNQPLSTSYHLCCSQSLLSIHLGPSGIYWLLWLPLSSVVADAYLPLSQRYLPATYLLPHEIHQLPDSAQRYLPATYVWSHSVCQLPSCASTMSAR
jgi:hypothetical protein